MKKQIILTLSILLIFIIPITTYSEANQEYGETVNELDRLMSILPDEDFVGTQQGRQQWCNLVMEHKPNDWYDVDVPYDVSFCNIQGEEAIQLAETVVSLSHPCRYIHHG